MTSLFDLLFPLLLVLSSGLLTAAGMYDTIHQRTRTAETTMGDTLTVE